MIEKVRSHQEQQARQHGLDLNILKKAKTSI